MNKVNGKNRGDVHDIISLIVQSNTEFANELYKTIREQSGNIFLSPYSISLALCMIMAGARGTTYDQMKTVLRMYVDKEEFQDAFAELQSGLDKSVSEQLQIRIANALWVQKDWQLLGEYQNLLEKYFQAQAHTIDFNNSIMAADAINDWVAEKTEKKIHDLIPSALLDAMTRLVLVNAIYFKGDWSSQFDPQLTSDAPFFVSAQQQVAAALMSQEKRYRYAHFDNLQILELPYASGDISMLVLLPDEKTGLEALEKRLSADQIRIWTQKMFETEVQVFLPRFEISFPLQLTNILQHMGMVDAFGENSDFSGMDGTRLLYISQVLHKAFVAVDERGTEAAAATGVIMQAKSMPVPPIIFRADHPFLFLIRENQTESILFLGRLSNPQL